jgi:hypothetical protein
LLRQRRTLDAAETMFFSPDGKIVRVFAHYSEHVATD